MTEKNKMKVVFAPGCFDHFDGTQEELDELVAEINNMVDSGKLFEQSKAVDIDDLDDDEVAMLEEFLNTIEEEGDLPKRLLN
jgi:hypothetical protein